MTCRVLAAAILCLCVGCGRGGAVRIGGPEAIYVGEKLAPQFNMGCITSAGHTDWITNDKEGFTVCKYPAAQQWGVVYIMSGSDRVFDYSIYNTLEIELKGEKGGEDVHVCVKTETDPNEAWQPSFEAKSLTKEWQSYKIPFSALLREPEFAKTRFTHLRNVCRINFPENKEETVYFRNVRFSR